MEKKRLFYILGGAASVLCGIFNLIGGGGWTAVLALLLFLATGAFLIVSAFVPKFPRFVPAIPMFVLAGISAIALMAALGNGVSVMIDYGFNMHNMVALLFNLLFNVLVFAAYLLAGLYMIIGKKMKKMFFLPALLLGVEAVLAQIYYFAWLLFNGFAFGEVIEMFFQQQFVGLIASVLFVVLAFFMCFARKNELDEEEASTAETAEGQTAKATPAAANATAAPNVAPSVNPNPAQGTAQPATSLPYSVLPAEGGQFDTFLHVVLLLFVGSVWTYIWIYRVTKFLNCDRRSKQRGAGAQTALCLFVPFYSLYWLYKSCKSIENLAEERKVNADVATLSLILAIFGVGFISYILMQMKINEICKAPVPVVVQQPVYARPVYAQPVAQQPVYARPVAQPAVTPAPAQDKAAELKKYKELLDSGAITQEEYDAMKKKILGL